MNRIALLLLLWLIPLTTVRAASIDCTRPTTPVDRTICQHETTVHIDADLATLFQKVDAGYEQPQRASLIRDQRHWLSLRGEACMPRGYEGMRRSVDSEGIEECLVSVYQERMRELQDLSDLQTAKGHARSADDVEAILDDPSVLAPYRAGMHASGYSPRVSRTPSTCRELFTLFAGVWTYGDDTIGMSNTGVAFNACSFSILGAQNFAGTTHREEDIDFGAVMRYSTDFRCIAMGCDHIDTGTRDSFYRKGIVTTFGQEIANKNLNLEDHEIPEWGDEHPDNVFIVGRNFFYIDSMVYRYKLSPPGDYTGHGRREVLISLRADASPGTLSIFETLVAYYDPKTDAIRPEVLDFRHPLRAVPGENQ